MPEVAEVRGRGFMVGIDLGEHDPALRLGHRVTLEARERGRDHPPARRHGRADAAAGDLEADLRRLVEITADSIRAACAGADRRRAADGRAARRGLAAGSPRLPLDPAAPAVDTAL